WRKRWFILQSGQVGSEPGVLKYYKHDQSKKPLWIISLDLFEQVQANVTFHKNGLPCDFVFYIKTNKLTFYLVAETKEDMYKWVQSTCQVCGFQQEVESTDLIPSLDFTHHSQPALLTGKLPEWEEAQPTWSSRAPQQHLHLCPDLDQCMIYGAESARSDNFSHDARVSFLSRSKMDTQKFAQGGGPFVCKIRG
ncbi:GRB2-associated-binding protein 2, partial [Sciurus carolinensis]|nr:GRB2-associated-binding protein 2 [Sciurus carolinensis]